VTRVPSATLPPLGGVTYPAAAADDTQHLKLKPISLSSRCGPVCLHQLQSDCQKLLQILRVMHQAPAATWYCRLRTSHGGDRSPFNAELSDRKICLDGTCSSKYVIAFQLATVSIAFELGPEREAGWCCGITAYVALDRTCCQEVKQPAV
jgi:hypothetical protein